MRRNIVHEGAAALRYAIREIVGVAHEIRALGREITWENIGDPIEKGDRPPEWMSQIIRELIDDPRSWAYSDTAGVPATREFLASEVNARGGVQISRDDILFFNGLGDAVARVYGGLHRDARVLGPSPAYSTHSSAEAAHSGKPHATYVLDPNNAWMPDVDDIRRQVESDPSIAGILLLSPGNPTGAVYSRSTLEEITAIAREHRLFMIADEIYANVVYNGNPRLHMSEWVGDVPALAMRGISKEYPWPGARCGWLEILNRDQDREFARYVESILAAKRLEVCSTTLPQLSIPRIVGDERYDEHLANRELMFEARAAEACRAFEDCDAVVVNKPAGAFYFTVVFKDGVLNGHQSLAIEDSAILARVRQLTKTASSDERFAYYLMGATGIVVVPLSTFQCHHNGFRFTLLETSCRKRAWIFCTLREAIDRYVAS